MGLNYISALGTSAESYKTEAIVFVKFFLGHWIFRVAAPWPPNSTLRNFKVYEYPMVIQIPISKFQSTDKLQISNEEKFQTNKKTI